MAEYIEKQAAIDALGEEPENWIDAEFDLGTANQWRLDLRAIKAIPPADVRPVVTCGKCKHGKYTGVSWFCDKHSGHADKFGEDASYHEYHSKYWFCADGEEKNHA